MGSVLSTPQEVVFLIFTRWRTGAEGTSTARGQREAKEKTPGGSGSHPISPSTGREVPGRDISQCLVPLWTVKQTTSELRVSTEQCIICIEMSPFLVP